MDNQFQGNRIKLLADYHADVQVQIDQAEKVIGQRLLDKRNTIFGWLDERVQKIKDQLLDEAARKKADQYDFKEREKELNEHLETMTSVAQKIDDDNKLLQLKNQELKIKFASQEDDRDLLLRQLLYFKKENQKMRDQHTKLKKQAEKLQEAEKAE